MVKIALQIKATFENIETLSANSPGYNFLLKIKCLSCGEVSDKWHDVNDEFTVETARSETNFLMKCKFCSRENRINVLAGSSGK